MKKCLIVIQNLTKSGSPQTFLHVIEVLRNAGYSVDTYVYALRNKSTDLYLLEEYKNACTNIYFSKLKLNGLSYKFFPFLKFKRIKKTIKNNKYDLVISNNIYFIADCCAHKKSINGAKVIFYALGNVNIQSRYAIIQKKEKYIRQYIKFVDAYLALSSVAVPTDDIVSKDKITFLMDYPNEYFPSIQKDLHEGIILGQIGYYCGNKNQLFTLEILNDLVRNGKNARIYFIGYPSSEEPQYIGRMMEYIHKNNLESHIKFLPSNSSKEQFFKKIDMLLLPSIHEGLSLTLMEAQFSNIFCLASSGVPTDVNFGLCKFIELRKEFWIDAIESFNDLGQLKPTRIYKKEEFEETLMSVVHQIFVEDYGE